MGEFRGLSRLVSTRKSTTYPTSTKYRSYLLGESVPFPARVRRLIRLDDEWKSKMSRLQRALVTTATFPWLMRYRYPLLIRD